MEISENVINACIDIDKRVINHLADLLSQFIDKSAGEIKRDALIYVEKGLDKNE